MAKTLENVKNELSGALRLQNALEDECDDSKRNVKRLERDMIDVEKERDFLKERMLVVENRCTELLMLQKEHANVVIERDQCKLFGFFIFLFFCFFVFLFSCLLFFLNYLILTNIFFLFLILYIYTTWYSNN